MKDDVDHLFGLQGTPADSPDAMPPPPRVATMEIALFRAGMPVTYQGARYTVSHVMIARSRFFVQLNEIAGAVKPEELQVEKTHLLLGRSP